MSVETVSFSIRMPIALRNEIERFAGLNGLSNAKQIIRFIEQGLEEHKRGHANVPNLGQLGLRVERLEHQMKLLSSDYQGGRVVPHGVRLVTPNGEL